MGRYKIFIEGIPFFHLGGYAFKLQDCGRVTTILDTFFVREKHGKASKNEMVIPSAYGRNNAQYLLDNCKIYYVNEDKKKTKTWLGRTRLQLPVGPNQFDHINIISNVGEKSNSNIKNSKKNIGKKGETKYSLKEIPSTIQKDVVANRRAVAEMDAVTTIPDTLFARGKKTLSEQVEDFFAEKGNNAYNDVIGDVELNHKGVKSDIAHGMGRVKAITFGAVPEVIEKGKVIDYQKSWKGRTYDTVAIAAPISVNGDSELTGNYLTVVIAIRDEKLDNQRFYVHESMSIKREELLFKTWTAKGELPGNTSSHIVSLLQKTLNYKWEDTKFSLKNMEGDSLFSSKKDDFAWMEEILEEEDSVADTASILQEGVESINNVSYGDMVRGMADNFCA